MIGTWWRNILHPSLRAVPVTVTISDKGHKIRKVIYYEVKREPPRW